MQTRIHHLAVWILVVIEQCIGGLWYRVFNEMWIGYHGKLMTDIDTEGGGFAPFVVSIAACVAVNYALAWLLRRLNIQSAGGGLRKALICWLAFFLMPYATIEAFSAFGRNPSQIVLINGGYWLIVFALSGAGLAVWRKRA
jgi:Protein of unknown function (DUF1761)